MCILLPAGDVFSRFDFFFHFSAVFVRTYSGEEWSGDGYYGSLYFLSWSETISHWRQTKASANKNAEGFVATWPFPWMGQNHSQSPPADWSSAFLTVSFSRWCIQGRGVKVITCGFSGERLLHMVLQTLVQRKLSEYQIINGHILTSFCLPHSAQICKDSAFNIIKIAFLKAKSLAEKLLLLKLCYFQKVFNVITMQKRSL